MVMEHTLHVLTSRWKRGIDGETLKKKNCPREDLRSQKEPRTVRLKRGRAPSPCWAMATTSAASASTEGHARSRKVTQGHTARIYRIIGQLMNHSFKQQQ